MCNGSVSSPELPHVVDNSGWRELPVGIEDFERVVQDFVYVDKTLVIRNLIRRGGTTLFCRPRRFGKSLGIRMLQCFFEAPVEGYVRDRRSLFENLAIAEAGERFWRHRGLHPVVRLNLSGVDGATWSEARERVVTQVAAEFERHRYVLGTGRLSDVADAVVPRELRAPNLEVGSLYQRELLERATRVAGGFGQLPFEGSRRAR